MAPPGFVPRTTEEHRRSLDVALANHKSNRHLTRFTSPEEPYFHLSDTAWATFHRLDLKEAELLLRNRADKGFTCIMIVVFVQHGAFLYPNREGNWPFAPAPGHQEKSGEYLPDLLKPNPKYFEFVDKVIDLAHSLGLTIALLPTWGRYVTGGYYGSPILFNEENALEYGRFIGERYPFHPFFLGGDTNRYWNPDTLKHIMSARPGDELEVIDYGPVSEAMAKGLIEGEKKAIQAMDKELQTLAKGYKTFMTFHSASSWLTKAPVATGSAQFPDSEWLTFDSCQTGHHDSFSVDKSGGHAQAGAGSIPMWKARSPYQAIRLMYEYKYKNGEPKPCIDIEPHYENTHEQWSLDMPFWKGRDIRNGAWQSVFAGACGYVYGCNSIIQMHNDRSKTHLPIVPPTTAYTNWYLELDLEGTYSVSTLRKIVLSLPHYHARIPDQEFITSDTHEPSDGSAAGDKLISGMRADGWAMVHLPYGGSVEVDLAKALPGQTVWRGWWINPRSGSRESFTRGEEAKDRKTFTAPSEGTLDDDWLLLLEVGTRIWP